MSESPFQSDKLQELLDKSTYFTKQMGVSMAASMLYPHVLRIFTKYDADQVEKFIRVDYRLVRNHLPQGSKNALRKLDPQWGETIMQLVTPENILHRLENPDEWVDEDAGPEEKREMQRAADIIRTTPGGMQWLEREVLDLYRIAGIIPRTQGEEQRRGNGNG